MNRKSYIDLLQFYLKDLPENIVKDIVLDYEEHFAMGLEAGKTEEEISEELGDPMLIANEFLNIEPGRKKKKAKVFGSDKEKKELSGWDKVFKYIGIGALVVVLAPFVLSAVAMVIAILVAIAAMIFGLFVGAVGIIGALFVSGGAIILFPFNGSFSLLTNILIALFFIALAVLLTMLLITFVKWIIKQTKNLYMSLKWRWEKRKNER